MCEDPFTEMDNDWIFPIYLNLPLPTFRHSWQIRGKLFPFHLDLAPDVFTSRWFLAISYFRPGCPRLIVLSFARASTLTRIPRGAASSFAQCAPYIFALIFHRNGNQCAMLDWRRCGMRSWELPCCATRFCCWSYIPLLLILLRTQIITGFFFCHFNTCY